jgi:hypothetical protein
VCPTLPARRAGSDLNAKMERVTKDLLERSDEIDALLQETALEDAKRTAPGQP